ncbi:MAG: hypothetical protein IKN05_03830, partial [Clostridia bacterium]|nr:hypothetical protein [Clostridia bacterium]
MMRTLSLLIALALAACAPALAHTRDEVRAACPAVQYAEAPSPYAEPPRVEAPYAAGALTED